MDDISFVNEFQPILDECPYCEAGLVVFTERQLM